MRKSIIFLKKNERLKDLKNEEKWDHGFTKVDTKENFFLRKQWKIKDFL